MKSYKDGNFRHRLEKAIGDEKPFVFAKRLGIDPSSFSNMWNQGSPPGAKTCAKLALDGIGLNWLLTGTGPERIHPETGVAERGRAYPENQEDREKSLRDSMKTSTQYLTATLAELGFNPGVEWTALVQELLVTGNLTQAGATRILETLKNHHD